MGEQSSSNTGLLGDKRAREFAFFLIKLVLIWLSWKVWIWFIGEEAEPISKRHWPALSAAWEGLNDFLRSALLHISDSILHLLGYKTQMINEYVLRIECERCGGISLGNYCLGFQLMYYFSMLFLVSSISPAKKAIGIIGGILLINGINVFRIVTLIIVNKLTPGMMWLYHDHVFNVTVAVVLLTFYWWMLREKKV